MSESKRAKMTEEAISIDASMWEGGGQIFRNSISFSVILGKKLKLHSIRSNRPTPGLHNQALAIIRIMSSIFGGDCPGAELGSQEITFSPVNDGALISSQSMVEEDVGTAGSLTLVLQSVLPCLVVQKQRKHSNCPVKLNLVGGTNVNFSPPIEHLVFVLLPLLSSMGIDVTAKLLRRGYYPRGGGVIQISGIKSSARISPINLVNQGVIIRAHVYVYSSIEDSGSDLAGILSDALTLSLKRLLSTVQNVDSDVSVECDCMSEDTQSYQPVEGSRESASNRKCDANMKKNQKYFHSKKGFNHRKKGGKCSVTLGALVRLVTDTGCIISADASVNERDYAKFDSSSASCSIESTIMSRLRRVLTSGACIDEQTADQLLIYMALAHGTSRLLCAPVCESDHSQHIESAIEVIKQFTQREISIDVDPNTKSRLIVCYENGDELNLQS